MSSQEKESYKDYLVRTVTQEIGNIFNQKMDLTKNEEISYKNSTSQRILKGDGLATALKHNIELKDINYKLALENTEEILKNYKKLKDHITMTDEEKKELLGETQEYHDKQIESIMTGLFSENELYLESLLKNRCKTKMFLDFIDGILQAYLKNKSDDKIEKRKKIILKELYMKGRKQSEFIYEFYEVDRTFYTDKDKLIKDLAPYFFGIKGINI